MILSVSRRTDIPSYYSEWFMNRLKAGYVLTKNPMNPAQVSRVTLSPENVDCIVFWTKDPANIMDKLSLLDELGYYYYFQFTLTPYGKELERNLRKKEEIIETFHSLAAKLGKERVIWRYDPIIINEELTCDYHMEEYEKLCRELHEDTRLCIISFVDLYQKISPSVKDKVVRVISEEIMYRLAADLAQIGNRYGIELHACCEKLDLTGAGIKSAACIDRELIERIIGRPLSTKKDRNQRTGCGCYQSVDIGAYNTCLHGCIYCYANHSDASIQRNYRMHDASSEIMIGRVEEGAKIIDRR